MSWIGPLVVTIFGGILRFHHLALPKGKVFDELYYVTGAQQLIANGVEFDLVKQKADFVVHPPLGKWVIAAGIKVFGDSELGWRVGVALLGTLSILILARAARRLFGSTLLGTIAGLLLAIDGLHFAHSRTALLDLTLMFFVLVAFAALLIDRDQRRARMAKGNRLGFTPYRWIAVVSLGLAIGVKWSGLYFLVAFAVMTFAWDLGAHRKYQQPLSLRSLLGIPLQWGLLPLVVYLLTWFGWFRSNLGWDRHWADDRATSFAFIPAPLRSLWHYHVEMYRFHVDMKTPHPYQANPWSWFVMGRPTAFYFKSYQQGEGACHVAKCSEAIMGIGNPLLWWAGTIAFFIVLWSWIARRDWRAGAIATGLIAGYLPWFLFQERTIYNFYAVVFVPWVVLAVTYTLGLILGKRINRNRAIIAGFIVLLMVATFFYMLPVLDATLIPESAWRARMWLPTWI